MPNVMKKGSHAKLVDSVYGKLIDQGEVRKAHELRSLSNKGLLDMDSVVREMEMPRFSTTPFSPEYAQNISKNVGASLLGSKAVRDLISQTTFSDEDLINTHPLDMTEPMLRAAQRRINEDEDFARRYRAGTDYTATNTKDFSF